MVKFSKIPVLCGCGCGEVVWCEGNYKRGHNSRISPPALGKIPWNKGLKGFLTGEDHPMFGKHHTEEARKKMSLRLKGHKAWNKGIPHSPETIQKQKLHAAKTFLGKKHTEESNRKNAEAHKGKHPSIETRKKMSNAGQYKIIKPETIAKIVAKTRGQKRSLEQRIKLSKACKGLRKGENNPNWHGGISFLPYCQKFNEELKERTRERDGRICQKCGRTETENRRKLSVHHIHYDKENCAPDLISVCWGCNGEVNKDREHWENVFIDLLSKRGLMLEKIL